jgi:crotonobetainyl-CoA hydratase
MDIPSSGFGGLTYRFDLSKPIIAAVNGVAMGGGFELALACDLVIASQSARFALPEPRVGLTAFGGGVQRLPREIGLKRAMALMLTGRATDAAEALSLGFVNEVVPAAELMTAARNWALAILACSPMAIRATKEAAMRGLDCAIATAIEEQWTYPAAEAMVRSKDFEEGPKAFVERRSPLWKGR